MNTLTNSVSESNQHSHTHRHSIIQRQALQCLSRLNYMFNASLVHRGQRRSDQTAVRSCAVPSE